MWNTDEEVWSSLDQLMKNAKPDLELFLGNIHRHADTLDLLGNAILFGGIGKLVMKYNEFRDEHDCEVALALAFKEMYSDRRVQNLIGHAVNTAIDSKVETMKGDA
tara:strand:- start:723 stop:1040 length:318 start_codon:yes stop_codon:yes gene_type:complete